MFPFTHLIFVWILGKGYEYFGKKKISPYAWFFLLFGSILPDSDFIFDWTLGTEFHRTFFHSLLFVFVVAVLVYSIFTLLRNKESNSFAYAIGVGILTHFILDMFLSQGVPLFWPNLLHFSFSGISYHDPATPSFLYGSAYSLKKILKVAIVDMGLGTAWLFYLAIRKRIKF